MCTPSHHLSHDALFSICLVSSVLSNEYFLNILVEICLTIKDMLANGSGPHESQAPGLGVANKELGHAHFSRKPFPMTSIHAVMLESTGISRHTVKEI